MVGVGVGDTAVADGVSDGEVVDVDEGAASGEGDRVSDPEAVDVGTDSESGDADGVSEAEAVAVGRDSGSGGTDGVSDTEAVAVVRDSESGEADGVSVALGASVTVAEGVSGNVALSLGSDMGVMTGSASPVSVTAGGGTDGDGSLVLAAVLTGGSVTATSVESDEVAEGMASPKDGEAEVGSERRGAASSSPASSEARAKRWCWVMVVPPGPVG